MSYIANRYDAGSLASYALGALDLLPARAAGAGFFAFAKGYQGLSRISQFLGRERVAAGAIDVLPRGRSLMLRPVEMEFPASGFSAQQQGLFAAHLNGQQIGLNYLSLQRTDDLLTNLANYPNIAKELKAARALGRSNIDGSGAGLDGAHRLDAVAGGYLHDFAGFRAPIQQRIGALWRTRTGQIVPGRAHVLTPRFEK